MKDNSNEEIEILSFDDESASLDEPTEMLDFSADLKVSDEIDEMLDFFDTNNKDRESLSQPEVINEVEKPVNAKIELNYEKEKLNEYVPTIKDFNIKSAKIRKMMHKTMLYIVIVMLLGFEFFVNKTGDILNDLRVYASDNQPIRIVQNEKYGYIDYTGRKIVNPKYTYGEEFIKGYAIVKNSSNLPLIINKGGKEIIPTGTYFSIYRAGTDIIVSKITKKGLKYGILDGNLRKKTEFLYDTISYDGNLFTYVRGNTVGLISKDGKDIFKYKLTDNDNKKLSISVSDITDDGFKKYGVVTVNSSSQIVNLDSGKTVSSPTLNEIIPEENNVFYEKLPNGVKKYLYVEDDKVLLESDDYIKLSISSSKTGVLKALDTSHNYTFISTKTLEQLKKGLREEETYDGDAAFMFVSYDYKKNTNQINIVKNGEVANTISGKFTVDKGFRNGIAIVKYNDGMYGYINSDGNFINSEHYIEAGEFDSYGDAVAKKDSGYGVIHSDGKVIIGFSNLDIKMAPDSVKKSNLEESKNIFYAVKKDNRYGLYSAKGKKINKEYYEEISFDDNYGLVKISTDIKDALIVSSSLEEISLTSSKIEYKVYPNYVIVKNNYYNYDGKLIYVDNSKGESNNE